MSKFKRYLKEMELMNVLKVLKSRITGDDSSKVLIDEDAKLQLKKDWMLLTKNTTCEVVTNLLENDLKVICNLKDKEGKIGLPVISLLNNFEQEDTQIILKGGVKHALSDRFLYNIKFITRKQEFSLEEHDEYFEKIEASSDEN